MRLKPLQSKIISAMSNLSTGGDTYFWEIVELEEVTGSKPQAIRRCLKPLIDSGEIVCERYFCEIFSESASGVNHYILKSNIEKERIINLEKNKDRIDDIAKSKILGVGLIEYQINKILSGNLEGEEK